MSDDTPDTNLRTSAFFQGQTHHFPVEMGFRSRRREPDEARGERGLGSFILPPFQRPAVWSLDQQIKFVESIWMGLPIPPYVYNMPEDTSGEVPVDYWLIDGQQRWTAVLDYVADKFPVMGFHWSEVSQRDRIYFEGRPWTSIRTEYQDADILKEIYDRLAYGGTPHDPAAREVATSVPSMR